MKKLHVSGVSPNFYRDIELIVGLFFPKAKVVEVREEADTLFHFEIQRAGQIRVDVTLTDSNRDQVWHGTHEWPAPPSASEKEERKGIKQVVNRALLQVMEEATGIRQPWGVLTGVRPTKLLHRMRLDGLTPDAAAAVLERDYRLMPVKIELLQEIVDRQTRVLPDLYELDREVSLYIGIPFCPTKCAYCTFPAYAIRGRNGSVEEFLAGLHEEMEAIGAWLERRGLPVTSIYFGGGTPTSITARQMEDLFVKMKTSLPGYEGVRELTVEAGRPDTLDAEKLDLLRRWKVDRISINPQSFEENTLKLIGRHHTVQETLEKYELARSMGLHNINMDLIIGLPGEGLDTFRRSLQVMEELKPESLTVHTLSFKRGSHMTRDPEKYKTADRDEITKMVNDARDWTRRMGYVPYYLYRQKNILGNQENVGYSFPGEENLYNIIIMEERQTIIGLGCGAVSKIIPPGTGRIHRVPNPKEPQAYINTYREHIRKKLEVLDRAYGVESVM
ncbi:oxygen-independent coproporphyrinogen-3 oxidase [Kroppenstedtia sanguinis]|uniref:Coproporphyrinogen III oxidase n=1 Tax=Kroppenstedtia sanguinis TaxID=1380684 RepID=A0ABW4C3T9_9BACL